MKRFVIFLQLMLSLPWEVDALSQHFTGGEGRRLIVPASEGNYMHAFYKYVLLFLNEL